MEILRNQYKIIKKKAERGEVLKPAELAALKRIKAELEEPDNEDLVFATIEEVEEYSGYGSSTIYTAVKKGQLLRSEDGSFGQDEVDRWLASKGRNPAVKQGEIQDAKECPWNKDHEDARYRHFRALREEVMYEKLMGALIPRDEVEHLFVRRALDYKTQLLLLSRMIAHRIAVKIGVETREISPIIDAEVRSMLKKVSAPAEIEVED